MNHPGLVVPLRVVVLALLAVFGDAEFFVIILVDPNALCSHAALVVTLCVWIVSKSFDLHAFCWSFLAQLLAEPTVSAAAVLYPLKFRSWSPIWRYD